MNKFAKQLRGGDLRSVGKANSIALQIKDQNDFNELFECLYAADRVVKMRAADAIEKCSQPRPDLLHPHKKEILHFLEMPTGIEFRWHMAQLLSRLSLTEDELNFVSNTLTSWMMNKAESRIVRVNALESLHNIFKGKEPEMTHLLSNVNLLKKENVPSLNARIRKLFGNKGELHH